jgi:voltage-gated potassium channel
MTEGHLPEARYCLYCGAALPPWAHDEASARRA